MGGDLLLAGSKVFRLVDFKWSHLFYLDEAGTLLVYDILLDSNTPRQVIVLSFEYGGISEICWLDTNNIAVGTTWGRIIVFSIKNELVSRQSPSSRRRK
jgi:hypothetical protein